MQQCRWIRHFREPSHSETCATEPAAGGRSRREDRRALWGCESVLERAGTSGLVLIVAARIFVAPKPHFWDTEWAQGGGSRRWNVGWDLNRLATHELTPIMIWADVIDLNGRSTRGPARPTYLVPEHKPRPR
jgi:hypothetical protein